MGGMNSAQGGMPAKTSTAALIIIGNELLSGKVTDSNANFFVKHLRECGVAVKLSLTLPDEIPVIADYISKVSGAGYDMVFTSGGVGPTHDDVTMEGIAKGLGVKLVRNAHFEKLIRDFYKEKINDHLLKMADIPDGAELIPAPGLFVPVVKVKNVYILPGDPALLEKKFLALKETFRCAPFYLKRLYTWKHEGEIAQLMHDAEKQYPDVAIGSYPLFGNSAYNVQVTLESKNQEHLNSVLLLFLQHIPEKDIVKVE